MKTKDKIRYKPLAKTDESDDDDDNDIVVHNDILNEQHIDRDEKNAITERFLIEEPNKAKNIFNDRCSRCRNGAFVFIFLFAVLLTLILIISTQMNLNEWKNYLYNRFNLPKTKYPTDDWTLRLENFGTESCIRLFDIDENGLDDIIFGLSSVDDASSPFSDKNSNEWNNIEKCGNTELSSNCKGFIYGMRGYDGHLLWKFSTKSEVFAINCHSNIDVDKDGKADCIASGRRRTLVAFDPRKGTVFWESHSFYLMDNWNIYTPLILPVDLNSDGVNEIIISHGGNPTIPSHVKIREPGRIILYSGMNGIVMGECLQLPDDKETYMSPVMFTLSDGSIYLLIGSGGETVPGSLYIMSLPAFIYFVLEDDFIFQPEKKPKFNGSYSLDRFLEQNYQENNYLKGLFSLYDSKTKGVMVPPVLVDVNHDGQLDIIMSAFDGTVILFNGKTLDIIWKKEYACHETYTSPAPGYFNDDDTVDFMFAQNYGAFDIYRYSIINIVDGKNGSTLWAHQSPRMQMISPLTIQNTQSRQDIFFYRIQGIEANDRGNISHQVYHGLSPQQPVDKPIKPKRRRKHIHKNTINPFESVLKRNEDQCPQFETLYDESHELFKPSCTNDELNSVFLNTYGLLVDRSTKETPLIVFKIGPKLITYNYTLSDVKSAQNFNKVKFEGENYGSTCIVLEPMERNTGAIADVDGDNVLDIITIVARDGMVKNIDNTYLKVLVEVEITKKSLNGVFEEHKNLNAKNSFITVNFKSQQETVNIKDLKHSKTQSWNSYMGYQADSIFHQN